MRELAVWGHALVIIIGLSIPPAWCEDSKTVKSKTPPLSVRLGILSQQYCRSVTDYVRIRCRIQFINTGQQRLILDKRSGTVSSMRVVKNRTKPDSKPFELIQHSEVEYLGESGRIRNLQTPSPDEFVILKTGESFKKETWFDLSSQRGDTKFNSIYGPGEYVVTVGIDTWVASPELGPILQKRWKKWGNLWHSTGVSAEPIRVTIAENPKIEDCSGQD